VRLHYIGTGVMAHYRVRVTISLKQLLGNQSPNELYVRRCSSSYIIRDVYISISNTQATSTLLLNNHFSKYNLKRFFQQNSFA